MRDRIIHRFESQLEMSTQLNCPYFVRHFSCLCYLALTYWTRSCNIQTDSSSSPRRQRRLQWLTMDAHSFPAEYVSASTTLMSAAESDCRLENLSTSSSCHLTAVWSGGIPHSPTFRPIELLSQRECIYDHVIEHTVTLIAKDSRSSIDNVRRDISNFRCYTWSSMGARVNHQRQRITRASHDDSLQHHLSARKARTSSTATCAPSCQSSARKVRTSSTATCASWRQRRQLHIVLVPLENT